VAGKVINLRTARKSRLRAEKREETARKTGTGKPDRDAALKDARHEGHKLTRDDD
jgi:hypothetical protein